MMLFFMFRSGQKEILKKKPTNKSVTPTKKIKENRYEVFFKHIESFI